MPEMPEIIQPTVGRIVHFYDARGGGPRAAIIAYVHDERLINASIVCVDGTIAYACPCRLRQPMDEVVKDKCRCEWMPYQVQKALGGDVNSESAEPRLESKDA